MELYNKYIIEHKGGSVKKKVLIPYPSLRDMRELALLKNQLPYQIIFDTCSRGMLEYHIATATDRDNIAHLVSKGIADRVSQCKQSGIIGVVSSWDYPGNVLSVLIANEIGALGPDPELILMLHHKYYARELQKKLVPECIPEFALVGFDGHGVDDVPLPYPFFIKPVKAYRSMCAYAVHSAEQLHSLLHVMQMPPMFLEPFNYLLDHYSSLSHNAYYMIVESLLTGDQVTLEGYIFNGTITIMGITDSIMYPGTISFERFEYPSRFPESIQKRMECITKKLIGGLGLDNTMFNIEFMYDEQKDEISLIELNPRMAHQFADLYEKVDGTNGYQVLLDIAMGVEPTFKKGSGQYACAASCVMRTFKKMRVIRVPDEKELAQFKNQFPDARLELYAIAGAVFDDQGQDAESYKYAIINIGGYDRADLLDRYEKCKRMLPITLAPI